MIATSSSSSTERSCSIGISSSNAMNYNRGANSNSSSDRSKSPASRVRCHCQLNKNSVQHYISETRVVICYFARDKYVCLRVCLSVCLSARISPEPHAQSLPIFVHVAYVHGSVLLRHLYDRPHRLSLGRGSPIENALSAGKGDGSAQHGRSMQSTIALLHFA